ncbi:flavin-dependent oxidoreductase [Pseudaestuariivita sp.]|uniref:flavin-dependent oxidoreductase n=1 Tax=Pseudaestuariivita sp. TaxID=2211669 RepID=UPI00405A1FFE
MILIAGGGIAGLTLGLTLHGLGLPFRIFEAVQALKPMGVGINIQPTAVRELQAMGLTEELRAIGVETRELGFYTKTGREIWREPRGQHAGYTWPQVSVHRGKLQMMLHDALIARAGAEVLATGRRVSHAEGQTLHFADGRSETGTLIIAADGIHSALRAQMVPGEGAPKWNGVILWRGTTRAAPFLSGASMVMIGHNALRCVAYPISAPGADGLAEINWIAEERRDPSTPYAREDWTRPVAVAEIAPKFADWQFDWIDVPGLISRAEHAYEYPMVDRDPLPGWTQGPVTLMGDAAHPTYPVGSNGASQAILDARHLGRALREHGVTPEALDAYEAAVRPTANAVIAANRGEGPDAILQRVEDLSGGVFDRIDDVIPRADLAAHATQYKALAGLDIDTVNAQPGLL